MAKAVVFFCVCHATKTIKHDTTPPKTQPFFGPLEVALGFEIVFFFFGSSSVPDFLWARRWPTGSLPFTSYLERSN